MKSRRFRAYWAMLAMLCATPAAQAADFNFAVIGQTIGARNDPSPLVQAIADSDADNVAFVIANGFKRADEACSDQLYESRRDVLGAAKNGLILSLAGADWSECKDAGGHSAAVERLSRVRELFYVDELSFGASKIPVMRQSNAVKYRSYAENARWEVDGILFATVNLPAMNNHYRMEAGRNSEFEDRLIATRDWLQRAFAIAARKKMSALVLICDGDPLQKPGAQRALDANAKRDGFAEVRQQLTTLAGKFAGKVLIVHNRQEGGSARTSASAIAWHGNVGELEVGAQWVKIGVKEGSQVRFVAARGASGT